MMGTEDGRALEMKAEGEWRGWRGWGGAAVLLSVTNDGGRSEPFHS